MRSSPDKSTYSPGEQVKISTSVGADGGAVSGASVSVAVKRHDGRTVTLSAITGADGMATVTLRTKRQDPRGTYVITTTATAGAITGQAGSSFTVQ